MEEDRMSVQFLFHTPNGSLMQLCITIYSTIYLYQFAAVCLLLAPLRSATHSLIHVQRLEKSPDRRSHNRTELCVPHIISRVSTWINVGPSRAVDNNPPTPTTTPTIPKLTHSPNIFILA
ncbi:uncharacterized protein LOC132787609 [Drosophila nasuta]|uniref:uncharacterized protein LOC132787609 n=1 Tax=Drosophila nasuta TaxID=42062 RepID=UPI00295E9C0E|nr:uncharacterized protein LOC132787609 [Drosophila nasuta]